MATMTSPAPVAFPDPKPLASATTAHSSSSRASIPQPPQTVPNGHTHAHAHTHMTGAGKGGDSVASLGEMDAKCGGCGGVIEQDNGGIVVAFGNSLWHVDCFKCTKCKEKVSADTNLLLLSDGSPVCGNCSYQCFVCKQAITEEAIMTGDESYHAHCFTCRTCKKRIEELVFAKTSQGIYCMACHNERVAKSRRHAEAKRQRAARKEKEREGKEKEDDRQPSGRSMSSSSLGPNSNIPPLQPSINPLPPTSSSPTNSPFATPNTGDTARLPDHASPMANGMTSASEDDHSVAGGSMSGSRSRELSVEKPLIGRSASPNGNGNGPRWTESTLPPLPQSPSEGSYNLGARSRVDGGRSSPGPATNPNVLNNTASSPNLSPAGGSRSQSPGIGLGVGPVGTAALNVPSTKSERRRSINPAMTFNLDPSNSTFAVEPRLSPLPPSPLRASFTDINKAASASALSTSPTSPSPQPATLAAEGFPFKSSPNGLQRSTTPDSHAPPPRKSSLTDVGLAIAQPRSRSHSATASTPPPVLEEPVEEVVPSTTQASSSMPKLIAPNLPTMSFSLSDPDFALILNGIDQSPTSEKKADAIPVPAAPASSAPPAPPKTEIDLDDTPPSSPMTDAPISRSPPVSNSAYFRQLGDRDSSPNRTRLSPNSQNPPVLRTRQPSAESTHSISGRLGPDSAFSEVVGVVAEAKHGSKDRVEVDVRMLSGIVSEVEELKEVISGLRNKYTGAKRTSQQYSEGLTVAGEEYDKEVALRRDMEAEIMRLKAQVHSQTARLSVVSGDERRQENMRRRSHDLANSLTGLERDISRLRAQRDMTIAEVEELQKRHSAGPEIGEAGDLSQSLTNRLDTIKEQYREELEPLTAQREALQREIADLRETRDQFLEESTALAAKNEELAELNTQLSRQVESMQENLARQRGPTIFNKRGHHPSNSPSLSSLATSATLQEVPEETARVVKVTKPEPQPIEAAPARRFKWYGYKSSKGPSGTGEPISSASISRPLALGLPGPGGLDRKLQRPSTEFGIREHSFQQHSSMRFAKCDLCGEKMWGLQEVKCSSCGTVCHAKCAEKLPRSCAGSKNGMADHNDGPLPPSMFGRDLAEQASADRSDVPVIVTKSISAVEAVGMEYEGIYRKTGGSSQSKQIQQLFERGDYDAFDLADVEAFNDISSVTSTLKTYFRQLPNPLLTHALHESFVAAATIKDMSNRHTALTALLKELPKDHYNTLRALMLHLNRVTAASGTNLMTSQNLGVVFGPTLMRSSDPNREFGDMGGKAMCIQWMVENAAGAFAEER